MEFRFQNILLIETRTVYGVFVLTHIYSYGRGKLARKSITGRRVFILEGYKNNDYDKSQISPVSRIMRFYLIKNTKRRSLRYMRNFFE